MDLRYSRVSPHRMEARGRVTGAQETCISLLRRLLPDESDFDRMKWSGVKLVAHMEYEEFLEHNTAIISAMSNGDCAFYSSLFERIIGKQIKGMDMESCPIFRADSAFFDEDRAVVIVTPR